MARPKWIPDENEIRQIEAMAGMGLTQREIVLVLGVSERAYRNRKGEYPGINAAWERGRATRKVSVGRNLLYLADPPWDQGAQTPRREPNLAAIIHWERTRGGMIEVVAHANPDGTPLPPPESVVQVFIPHNDRDPLPPGQRLVPAPSANGDGRENGHDPRSRRPSTLEP